MQKFRFVWVTVEKELKIKDNPLNDPYNWYTLDSYIIMSARLILRGCLYYTGMTFIPELASLQSEVHTAFT